MANDEHQSEPTGKSAQELLCWSMDTYASMSSFQAVSSLKNGSPSAARMISYEKPDRFYVQTIWPNGALFSSICDGNDLVETGAYDDQTAWRSPAPDSITKVSTVNLTQPLFCGSLLYQFFGGSENLERLADINWGPVDFGLDEVVDDEPAKTVKFYGRQGYGNVEALIGIESGLVYRINGDHHPQIPNRHDFDIVGMTMSAVKRHLEKMPPGDKRDQFEANLPKLELTLLADNLHAPTHHSLFSSSESFQGFRRDIEIPPETFASEADIRQRVPDTRTPFEGLLRKREPAVDFEVQSSTGEKTCLSGFNGQAVLIVIWTSWCESSRECLRQTAELAREWADSNVRVMVIVNEPFEKVIPIAIDEGLNPSLLYADKTGELWSRYLVAACPTTAVISPDGRLTTYRVGFRPTSEQNAVLRGALIKF